MYNTQEQLIQAFPSLRNLPGVVNDVFMNTYNQAVGRGNSVGVSAGVAWNVVKNKFERQGTEWVAKSGAFKEAVFYSFKAEKAEEFVSKTEDGHVIHNYVLTDEMPDGVGTSPTVELMQEWADWINTEQPEVDIDHELFGEVTSKYKGDISLISRAMRFKKGIAKTVKAVVQAGRLVVSLLFDKRYENHVNKVRGLSIEAGVERNTLTNKFEKGRLFGFTFAMNKNPVNQRAVRVVA